LHPQQSEFGSVDGGNDYRFGKLGLICIVIFYFYFLLAWLLILLMLWTEQSAYGNN
jgi:hypothetical protein